MQTHTHPARGGCACLLFVRGDIERESAPSCALGDSQGVKSLERVRPERQCRQPAPSACRSRKPAPRVGGGLASFRSERGESGGRRRGTGEHKSAANCALGDSQGVKSLERVRAEPAVTPRAQARKRRTRPRRRTRHRACEKLRAAQRQRPSPPRGEQRRSPPPQRPLPKASSVARTSLPATAAARAAQSIPNPRNPRAQASAKTAREPFPARRKALSRAQTPARAHKCTLCSRGIILLSRPACVFQTGPRFLTCQGRPEKGGGFLVGHGPSFRRNALKGRAPDAPSVAALPALLLGQLLPQHLFPVLKLSDFLLSLLDLGGPFPAGFSLGFVMAGRPFLLMGKRKEQPFSWLEIAALWVYIPLWGRGSARQRGIAPE